MNSDDGQLISAVIEDAQTSAGPDASPPSRSSGAIQLTVPLVVFEVDRLNEELIRREKPGHRISTR